MHGGTLANWYTTRERIKYAGGIQATAGASPHPQIDRIIEAKSRQIDNWTRTWFLPKTETRLLEWPKRLPSLRGGSAITLWLPQYLLATTTLKSEAQNSSPTTISSSDYFEEPNGDPPYDRIEIDRSSTASFSAGDTPQRSISVLGRWGYSEETISAGTVASGLSSDAAASTMVCSDASLIDVGNSLLIESEMIFVKERSFAALGSVLVNMGGNIAATQSVVTITLDGSHGVVAGEIIRLDSERMLVVSVATNDLTVIRAFDGSVLASHTDDTAVHISRTLNIERGVNGTTAATHANATAISKYQPEYSIQDLCQAEVLSGLHQERAGYGRTIGGADNPQDLTGKGLAELRMDTLGYYRRRLTGAI